MPGVIRRQAQAEYCFQTPPVSFAPPLRIGIAIATNLKHSTVSIAIYVLREIICQSFVRLKIEKITRQRCALERIALLPPNRPRSLVLGWPERYQPVGSLDCGFSIPNRSYLRDQRSR